MLSQRAQCTLRSPRLVTIGLAAILLMSGVLATALADGGNGSLPYEGADMLTVVGVGPNPARCGDPSAHIELHFAGQGTDTVGGPFFAVASACQNIITNEVSDLQATDTYNLTGDTVSISSEPFILAPNPTTCVASNDKPVQFTVTGGTGAFANATGSGKYDIYVTNPDCSGVTLPALVAFRGKIHL